MDNAIYYDGDCPFCTRYTRLLKLRSTIGPVRLVDVRNDQAVRADLMRRGFDLDNGMVAEIDGHMYAGGEAMQVLAQLSTSSGLFNHLNRFVLSSRLATRFLYPLLRCGRGLTLTLLGREPIGEMPANEQAFRRLFCMAWGLFAYLHVVVYAFQFKAKMAPVSWLIAPLGIALFWRPLSRRIFLVLLGVMMVDGVHHIPSLSNHTLLKNIFLLALACSGLWYMLRGGRVRQMLAAAAPVGRFALACMYVFGVFHKLNTGFLDPQVSCAVALWRAMPAPLSWIDFPAFHHLAIWGTLVIESFILGCLLSAHGRHIGIVAGICFHSLLAMSDYALYAPFSTLTIALHLLYLPPRSALHVCQSVPWQGGMRLLHSATGMTMFGLWAVAIILLAWNQSFGAIGVMWLPLVLFLCYCVWKHGAPDGPLAGSHVLVSRAWLLNGISVLFFLTCFSPYLGLKTAQSMNMFANLRLEGGVSNHILFGNPPRPFGYLEDIVQIRNPGHSPYLQYIVASGLHVTYYDLLDRIERDPSLRVDFVRGGNLHSGQTRESLAGEIASQLHPRWVRGWLHFTPVDLQIPKPCALNR